MNARNIKTLATLALTAVTALSLQAVAAEPDAARNPSARVSFRNVDFDNANAVAGLYRRIQKAASMVCYDGMSPWDASKQRTYERCYTASVETAVSQVNRPQLTALHRGETKPVLAAK